jgi:hypothetical protein
LIERESSSKRSLMMISRSRKKLKINIAEKGFPAPSSTRTHSRNPCSRTSKRT